LLLLDALTLNPTSRRPVWIMRQAGRYLASFRKIRERHSFDETCGSPELATEVSLLPLKRYPSLDACIVFSDILFPLRALGADLEYTEAGPVLIAPKNAQDLSKLRRHFSPEESTSSILKTLRELRKILNAETALLGFAGAPFTMLCYLLEGKLSPELKVMKRWMAKEPIIVHSWLKDLAACMGEYLDAQARAGANAVQLFDTWAGQLSSEDYARFALPYAREALSAVTVPSIYYVNGVAGILEDVAGVGAQALSIDWRISLAEARKRVSGVTALQGNLDPHHLHLPRNQIREEVFRICEAYGRGPGHIMNLGHGIIPEVPEDSVQYLIEATAEWSASALTK